MSTLLIVHGTTRPSRQGIHVSRALAATAREHTEFSVDLADLAELDLPFLNEESMPRAGRYELPHTLDWARRVDSADAVVWATSEYNGGYPAPLKNAIDFLYREWTKKPLGIIAWSSSPRGGAKSAAALAGVATHMGLNLLDDPLLYPEFTKDFQDDGSFTANSEWSESATALVQRLESAAGAQ